METCSLLAHFTFNFKRIKLSFSTLNNTWAPSDNSKSVIYHILKYMHESVLCWSPEQFVPFIPARSAILSTGSEYFLKPLCTRFQLQLQLRKLQLLLSAWSSFTSSFELNGYSDRQVCIHTSIACISIYKSACAVQSYSLTRSAWFALHSSKPQTSTVCLKYSAVKNISCLPDFFFAYLVPLNWSSN